VLDARHEAGGRLREHAGMAETEPAEGVERRPPRGLSSAEAQRLLLQYGPNELVRCGGRRWPRELLAQFVHPLALLLWAAAGLAVVAGLPPLAVAIVAVVVLDALFGRRPGHLKDRISCGRASLVAPSLPPD